MRACKGIVVLLDNEKELLVNGVKLKYDHFKKEATTNTLSNIAMMSDHNSPLYAPDRGVVLDSDVKGIEVGDVVILEYFAVVRALGKYIEEHQERPDAYYEETPDGIVIPVRVGQFYDYVYAIFRNGEYIQFNDWEVVEVLKEKVSNKIYAVVFDKVTQKYQEAPQINKCEVLYGELKGKVCVYNPNYLLGEAQQTLLDGRQVRFIKNEHVYAEIEE